MSEFVRASRLYRSDSGPLYAADGPIARAHTLIQGDRTRYRKHEEDNTKLTGYMVKSVVEDEKAGELVRGHELGKEIKRLTIGEQIVLVFSVLGLIATIVLTPFIGRPAGY